MSSNITIFRKFPALRTIFWAGAICGTMDITAALTVYPFFGAKPLNILNGIAAGVLGDKAFQGGWETALLGLCLHFTIAYGAATVFYLASRRLTWLLSLAEIAGVLYGIVVYFFMNRIVVPLSLAHKNPFSFKMTVVGIVIHIFCVGLPIAMTVHYFSVHGEE